MRKHTHDGYYNSYMYDKVKEVEWLAGRMKKLATSGDAYKVLAAEAFNIRVRLLHVAEYLNDVGNECVESAKYAE